jgi:hypothetical protein
MTAAAIPSKGGTVMRFVPVALILWIAFVFIQSLFFKFTDSPETVHIFGTLDGWADGFGLGGIFAPGGLFSAKVVGSFELVASLLLLGSLAPALGILRPFGALLSLGVISGAILFHLFTPLGIAVVNADGSSDGGLLFAMAVSVWFASLALLWMSRGRLLALLGVR